MGIDVAICQLIDISGPTYIGDGGATITMITTSSGKQCTREALH